jgi:hypothetical protein
MFLFCIFAARFYLMQLRRFKKKTHGDGLRAIAMPLYFTIVLGICK